MENMVETKFVEKKDEQAEEKKGFIARTIAKVKEFTDTTVGKVVIGVGGALIGAGAAMIANSVSRGAIPEEYAEKVSDEPIFVDEPTTELIEE